MSPNSPQPLTPAVFHVLLALSDGPLHGYGVMKRVEEEAGLEMGPGTIYGSIRRLQDSGWVEEGEVDGADRRRGRTFHLSEQGREALKGEATRLARLARLEGVRRLLPDPGMP